MNFRALILWSAGFSLFGQHVFADAFFSGQAWIVKSRATCLESVKDFTAPLSLALMPSQVTELTSKEYTGSMCLAEFVYYGPKELSIVNSQLTTNTDFSQMHLSAPTAGTTDNDLCPKYLKILPARLAKILGNPLLSYGCENAGVYYAYVNKSGFAPLLEEHTLNYISDNSAFEAQLNNALTQSGATQIVKLTSGNRVTLAYQLPAGAAPVSGRHSSSKIFSNYWVGFLYKNSLSKEEIQKAFDLESAKFTEALVAATTLGSFTHCAFAVAFNDDYDDYVNCSSHRYSGGSLPKTDAWRPGWWQEWVPAAGTDNQLIKCQANRESIIQNFETFTGKKALHALCLVNPDTQKLSYWVLGKTP